MAQSYRLSDSDMKNIEIQWNRLISGKSVDQNIVPPNIYKSWIRSKESGVDPYTIKPELFYTKKEMEENGDKLDRLKDQYGDVVLLMQEISLKTGLRFQLFDTEAQSTHLIVTDEDIKYFNKKSQRFDHKDFFAMKNVAEDQIGTTTIPLAIRENKPVQLLYYEHYHTHLHKANCSAAPIHDIHGNLSGVLNILSFDKKQTIEILGLATTLAKIFNDNLKISHMVDELKLMNSTLNEIIEYLPKGIIYLDHRGSLNKYNKKILDLFSIPHDKKPEAIRNKLQKHLNNIDVSISEEKDLSNKEVFLTINNEKKSFILSVKSIMDLQTQRKGRIIIFEETNNLIRLNDTLRGNQALYNFDDIITKDPRMLDLKSTAKLIAGSLSAVLIFGESGTGKELFAQAIHNASERKDRPFVAINCGAIPQDLIESELFGYQPGAFTGALKGGKPGKLEIASEGTLFLDEVESMPLITQIKLLRALSTNRISRVGSIKEVPINIRLVSATKKDLLKEAEAGNFREDLYYRIKIITLNLPPLRKRLDDIEILVDHFVKMFSRQFNISGIEISDEYIECLKAYHWNGNLRELKNVIERSIVLMGNRRRLTQESLPENILYAYQSNHIKEKIAKTVKNINTSRKSLLKVSEEIAIEMVLNEQQGNISKTAKVLGISRPTLYKKIQESETLKCKNYLQLSDC